jgi:hypothetical protein
MRKALAVRRFLAERERLFLHTVPWPETAIVAADPACPTFGGAGVEGAHKALAALHLSPVLMDETGVTEDFGYHLAVLPEQAGISDAVVRRIEAFVRRGGLLLTSGATIATPAMQALIGVKAVRRGAVPDGHVILRREEFGEPTGLDIPWDRLDLAGAEELYPLYLSWDSRNPECRNLPNNWPMHGQMDEETPEPAGQPAAVIRHLGRGRIVHLCADAFAQYRTLGDPQILRWFREVLAVLQPAPFCRTDAPSWIDLSLRRRGDDLLVHFVNQNPGRDVARLGSDDTWVDEIPEVGPFALELRLPRRPRTATWEPAAERLTVAFRAGTVRLEIPRFRIHGCAVVQGVPPVGPLRSWPQRRCT